MTDIALIIKIPKEDYLTYSELSEKEKINELSCYERIIANGTPLDDLRAEIEQMDFDFNDYYDHTDTIIEMVCKVIDKYKAEGRGE